MMRKRVLVLACAVFILIGEAFSMEPSTEVQSFPHGKVSLNLRESGAGEVHSEITFSLEQGWHIYGEHPGDVGLPTKIAWQIPSSIEAAPIRWPQAEEFFSDGIRSFGYEKEVTLGSALYASMTPPTGAQAVAADVSWILCNNECIPGKAHLVKEISSTLLGKLKPKSANADAAALPSFFRAVMLALLGGLLLNLMPCVFPVISIKILGFMEQRDSDPRVHAAAFSGGVIVSFWALAGFLLAVRAAGEKLGWGFQFQSPLFVAFMTIVLFMVALNLLGVYEIGGSVQTLAGRADRKHGLMGAFLSGVLATAIATPCTAPFMGTAIAAAFLMPWYESLTVFTALGTGMGLPYILLSVFPRALALLPRPGNWMTAFKQLLAFPLLGSVVWLLWVLRLQIGTDATSRFEFALVVLGLGLWAYGKLVTPFNSRKLRRSGVGIVIASLFLTAYIGWPTSAQSFEGDRVNSGKTLGSGLQWELYSPERVKELKASKKPFFLDVTAAWCLICQMNHHLVFDSKDIISKIKEKNITLLRGDWTNNDGALTAVMNDFGRDGVPLDVVYGAQGKATVLPSVLTARAVEEALDEVR